LKLGRRFSVTLFGDSGCFLPLYLAPFTKEQIERIQRYQEHPDYVGVLCHSCIRKEKMLARSEGMQCPHCGTIYVWAYGLLSREEAAREAPAKYHRPLSDLHITSAHLSAEETLGVVQRDLLIGT
jgi:predicted RNA-binding Zn-ribbon protein involved in translation (DUF1610 family)